MDEMDVIPRKSELLSGKTSLSTTKKYIKNEFFNAMKQDGDQCYKQQFTMLVNEASDSIEKYALTHPIPDFDFDYELRSAINLIDSLSYTLSQQNNDSQKLTSWKHNNSEWAFLHMESNQDLKPPCQDSLEEYAKTYLEMPWFQSPLFEWIIIDALIYKETIEFGKDLRRKHESNLLPVKHTGKEVLTKLSKSIFKTALIWILPLLIWLSNSHDTSYHIIFGLYFTYLFCNKIIKHFSVSRRYLIMYEGMVCAYKYLDDITISPQAVYDILIHTANSGAKWSGVVFPLLEKAIKRNEHYWGRLGRFTNGILN